MSVFGVEPHPPNRCPDWLQRIDRLFHAIVLRHVQGDLTWTTWPGEKTTCECGRVWRLNWRTAR
jgi:hypothetical protein